MTCCARIARSLSVFRSATAAGTGRGSAHLRPHRVRVVRHLLLLLLLLRVELRLGLRRSLGERTRAGTGRQPRAGPRGRGARRERGGCGRASFNRRRTEDRARDTTRAIRRAPWDGEDYASRRAPAWRRSPSARGWNSRASLPRCFRARLLRFFSLRCREIYYFSRRPRGRIRGRNARGDGEDDARNDAERRDAREEKLEASARVLRVGGSGFARASTRQTTRARRERHLETSG